ncbi:purine-nucleoside phosphorylase [uncultured Arcanobacterium sp.]|uniref:purine-nucleoside phosphorylase n=1 Tax=uncultured Arcanobacterium sp. TaxID=487520 RepID=UPI00261EE311|nr:purine-nucleoside phosphorylase [uncultured Arcanobacterium sp.]
MFDARENALECCFPYNSEKIAQINSSVQLIQERTQRNHHDLLVVLGSGLVDAVKGFGRDAVVIPVRDLPWAKEPAAEGHGKDIVSVQVELDGQLYNVLICTGRIHLYEGYSPEEICYLPQIAAMTGVKAAFLTNAGGCLNSWHLGELMAITDHVNLSGSSPFSAPVFIDIMRLWDQELTRKIEKYAQRRGVYAILRGPEFQTYAESVMMRNNGIDMVGMSTILEAIALHQLGVRVCGVSVTSDLSFSDTPTEHTEVLRAVREAIPNVQNCIYEILKTI